MGSGYIHPGENIGESPTLQFFNITAWGICPETKCGHRWVDKSGKRVGVFDACPEAHCSACGQKQADILGEEDETS